MSSIKKNLFLQTAYQILSACMPLITAPYLARVLGATQLGVLSFSSSIVAYFSLFAMLGTVNYGTRCIAAAKYDKQKTNEVFSSIYTLQIMVCFICVFLYYVYVFVFVQENKAVFIIQGISLFSCLFDVNWLFFGIEEFQVTVTRSIIIKILTVVFILLLVRSEADLWIYLIILLGGALISNLVLYIYLPKYVSFIRVSVSILKKHIIPNLILFVPLLAMSVYHTMDKTMLGSLSTFEQSGFYYNSDKVVQIPLLVVNGVGTVMLPRMTMLITQNRKKEADDLFTTTLEGVAAISIAVACGIAAISNEFIPFFFGSGYDECIIITIVFTPILLIKGFSSIIRTQYLIPYGLEKEFTKSVIAGAIINLILNIFLIPSYGALGAAIATDIAELVACIIQFYSLRGRKLNIPKVFFSCLGYLSIGLMMIFVVRMVSLLHITLFIDLVIEIISGALFYGGICIFYWIKTNNRFFELLLKPIICRFHKSESNA